MEANSIMSKLEEFPESEKLTKRLAHPCFPQPTEIEVPVWRYMNLAKLVSFLKSEAIYLSRLDQFTDPYEGTTTQRTADGIAEFLRQTGAKSSITEVLGFYEKSRKETFVSCWHANKHESEAMWRLYGGEEGVAIQSTYSALTESIRLEAGVYLGLVQYVDYRNASFPDANLFYPAMHKRASFSHEHEVRMIRIFPVSPTESQPKGLTLPIELGAICKSILVSPTAPRYYFEAVKAVVDAITPRLSDRVKWSEMSSPPLRVA